MQMQMPLSSKTVAVRVMTLKGLLHLYALCHTSKLYFVSVQCYVRWMYFYKKKLQSHFHFISTQTPRTNLLPFRIFTSFHSYHHYPHIIDSITIDTLILSLHFLPITSSFCLIASFCFVVIVTLISMCRIPSWLLRLVLLLCRY